MQPIFSHAIYWIPCHEENDKGTRSRPITSQMSCLRNCSFIWGWYDFCDIQGFCNSFWNSLFNDVLFLHCDVPCVCQYICNYQEHYQLFKIAETLWFHMTLGWVLQKVPLHHKTHFRLYSNIVNEIYPVAKILFNAYLFCPVIYMFLWRAFAEKLTMNRIVCIIYVAH